MKRKSGERLVFSTESGRICPSCESPVAECQCSTEQTSFQGDGTIRVRRESKGRRGKTVTVIDGAPLAHDELQALGRELKALCGSGGTTKGGVIEIQGDHRTRIVERLRQDGFSVKGSGG
ncbi:translation initiation factor Sui1 [bacterium]|nr:translation initiation factor Sui1 [bacterium]